MRSSFAVTSFALGILAVSHAGVALAADNATDASGNTAAIAVPAGADAHWGMLDTYCVECHNYKDWKGEIAFDTMTPEGIPQDAKIWETAIGRLEGNLMPPPGKKRPDQATIDSFVSWLEGTLDNAATANKDPGHVTLHRLNRTEYANEMKALFGLDIDVAALLPKDTETDGFDNIATSLQVSPTFLEQYIVAARKVTEAAIGKPNPPPLYDSISPPEGVNFTEHVEGLPLGTRGGMLYDHFFPADGEYVFNVNIMSPSGYYLRSHWLEYPNTLILTVDGDRVFEGHLGGDEDMKAVDQELTPAVNGILDRFKNIRVPIKAGPHAIGVTWLAKTFAESDVDLEQYDPGEGVESLPVMKSFEFVGPYNPTGISETPSRHKIFTCHPEDKEKQRSCASDILARMATQAFRRPVTDEDVSTLMKFYDSGAADDGFETGVQKGLMAMLSSPKFLYRAELPPATAEPGSVYRISDIDLASRLSFFLWSQGPDEELLKLAASNKLHDPQNLDVQVNRMLADPRAETLVTNFAFQWLKLSGLDAIQPDSKVFPNFDPKLREAIVEEMRLFLSSVLLEDRSVLDLLTADYTFANERLARHYGMPGVRGGQFRRVQLTDPNRYGLFGKAAILMLTSYPNRTSPVLRGAWILENIFGTPPTAPPPDVPPFPETQEGEQALTVRARLEVHRKDQACNFCHGVIDPLGMSLENLDAIGQWQTKDRFAGTPIDASGQMVDGTPLTGPVDLRNVVLKKPDQFVQTITEKLLMYALGRTLDYTDMPVVRAIVREAAANNYKFSTIVQAVVRSEPFQMKSVLTAEAAKTQEASADH
jgi:Protein of unknown function (DUF1592)/Protein of unknown function (DUF1588)/Protein of unknown function (DUF1585)/Protein of unknown function (DUF1595)/Protein of unknown function (DUF1587)